MGRAFLMIVLSCLVIACGDDDLEFGTSKKDGLRIGKSGESALHFGVKSGGGQSGSRRVEILLFRVTFSTLDQPQPDQSLSSFLSTYVIREPSGIFVMQKLASSERRPEFYRFPPRRW